ncbi:MAG: hypothetical protein HOM01_10675, partial [Kordiimonadaceae bacterium]|nr:hypothetical protein [Kordiimonadaceae bacterium]
LRKLITALLALTFIWLQTSVSYAENIHYLALDSYKSNSDIYGRNNKGLVGGVKFRLPFGARSQNKKESYVSFNMTYGQEFSRPNPFNFGAVREVNLLDGRFNKDGFSSLNLAGQVVVQTRNRAPKSERKQTNGLYAILAIGAVVGLCVAVGCFSTGDQSTVTE